MSQFAHDQGREALAELRAGDTNQMTKAMSYLVREGSAEDIIAAWEALGGTRDELRDLLKIMGD